MLDLLRWSVSSGSTGRSRAVVVLAIGKRRQEATAQADGPVVALLRAIDRAIWPVLGRHPRLLSYHARVVSPGHDPEIEVRLAVAKEGHGESLGTHRGTSRAPDVLTASARAYLMALEPVLTTPAVAAITEDDEGGSARSARTERAYLDPVQQHHEIDWFPH